jgi:hypothetical protein
MTHSVLKRLGFMAFATAASLAGLASVSAQTPAAQTVRADGIAPRTAQFYGADDPLIAIKNQVEKHMGVYLCDPPRRHDSERIHLKGKQARVDVWQPVSRLSDLELKNRAVEWLVFGRTVYSSGARGIFSEMPAVEDLLLVFHEVLRPDEKGRRKSEQPDQVRRYMALRIKRDRFNTLNMAALEGCVARADCSDQFRSAFNESRFDSKYTHKVRPED